MTQGRTEFGCIGSMASASVPWTSRLSHTRSAPVTGESREPDEKATPMERDGMRLAALSHLPREAHPPLGAGAGPAVRPGAVLTVPPRHGANTRGEHGRTRRPA